MVSAMNAVEKKEMTIYSAAARFSAPRKTLDDRIKGHVKRGTSPGPVTALEQEEALVSYFFIWLIMVTLSLGPWLRPMYGPLQRSLVMENVLIKKLGPVSIVGLTLECGTQRILSDEQTC